MTESENNELRIAVIGAGPAGVYSSDIFLRQLKKLGEELGLVGVLVVIGMFYWIIKRAFDIGRQAIAIDQTFAGLTAKGIAIWIGVQTFINMGVNLGLLPTKGLTLPLMSYGGTGVLINCIGLAILLRIDYENRILMRGGRL